MRVEGERKGRYSPSPSDAAVRLQSSTMEQKPPHLDLEESNPPGEEHQATAKSISAGEDDDQSCNQKQISRPAKISRIVSAEEARTVTMASPSPLVAVALGLDLGRGAAEKTAVRRPAAAAFTFMQRQELEQQAVIYKYIAAGLPVPVHLVLPIWKSVVSSLGPRHFPSLMSYYGSLCLDYRSYMQPEPGRCRRTDGKKWRCSRDVVVDHKYCERHMHRGRNRSRKPVEAAVAVPAAATTPSGATAASVIVASTAAGAAAKCISPPAPSREVCIGSDGHHYHS